MSDVCEPSLLDGDKQTKLLYACMYGDVHLVDSILSMEFSTSELHDALNTAIANGHLEIVKRLIRRGANITYMDESRRIPLIKAVEHNHIDIVKELIRLGSPINTRTHKNKTPLLTAIVNRNVDIVRLLLQHHANIYFQVTPYKDALWASLMTGNPIMVTEVLSTGKFDSMKSTGIIKEVLSFKPNYLYELIRILLEHGFDPNVADYQLDTALILSCKRHDASISKLLLQYGADPNKIGYANDSPLLWCVLNEDVELVTILLDRGANINTANSHGLCILDLACIHKIYPILDLLIERGAKVTIRALLTAMERSLMYSIRLILDSGMTLDMIESNRSLVEGKLKDCTHDIYDLIHDLLHMASSNTLDDILRNGYEIIHTVTPITWYSLLPSYIQMEWDNYVAEAKQTMVACYLAMYEEQDTMDRFRKGYMVHFSESTLRQLMRPYGARPMRNRVVQYLVHPYRAILFRRFRSTCP